MESIVELKTKIEELLRQKEMLDTKLGDAIVAAIGEVAKENPNKLNRVAKNAYVMRFSDFINKPWNATFFDWEKSAEFIVDFLKNKPKNEWCSILEKMLNDGKGKDVIYFDKPFTYNYERHVRTQPISRKFIELIIQKLK